MTLYPDGEVEISFPDLHATTQGSGVEQAFARAEEFVGLILYDLEEEGKPTPEPTSFEKLELILELDPELSPDLDSEQSMDRQQRLVMVEVDMTRIRGG